jgi:NAD(P)-dependent dehydrogenase (short-subunit alcohol dehydrogenase family)
MAIAEIGVDDIARVMALNYDVTVNYLVPLVAQMRRQRDGLIAQTNSLAGLMGVPRQGPYSAAKAAVRMLVDAARIELAPDGVRFTSIYPGFVATARVRADGLPKPLQISEEAAARHVVRALRREPANMSFPWTMSALVRLLRALPAPVSGAVLRKLAA